MPTDPKDVQALPGAILFFTLDVKNPSNKWEKFAVVAWDSDLTYITTGSNKVTPAQNFEACVKRWMVNLNSYPYYEIYATRDIDTKWTWTATSNNSLGGNLGVFGGPKSVRTGTLCPPWQFSSSVTIPNGFYLDFWNDGVLADNTNKGVRTISIGKSLNGTAPIPLTMKMYQGPTGNVIPPDTTTFFTDKCSGITLDWYATHDVANGGLGDFGWRTIPARPPCPVKTNPA